jgi:sigma-54 dependent transcriptional regulator, acetoin dehydrogenase operon transcriptional activator AcoR
MREESRFSMPATRTLQLDESGGVDASAQAASWLFLLLHRDRLLAPSARFRLDGANVVSIGRGSARDGRRNAGQLEIAIDDPWASTLHARLVREGGRFVLEDAGSRNGTIKNGAPLTVRSTLEDGDVIELGRTFFLYRESASLDPGGDLDEALLAEVGAGMRTLSPMYARELDRLARLARSAVSILAVGESGVGKEVLSRAVHALSGRPGPFLAVNCASLPDGLLQSELFGYRKGAFSGALEDRPGLVRSADGGTLLLDEIGDLGPLGQGALLRVLQEGEVTPVGDTRPHKVNVRIISATHRDLSALAASGTFRSDLLARLSGFVFQIPPLRDRREDLGVLTRALLPRIIAQDPSSVSLSQEAAQALLAYRWPLNVRELEKCLAAAVAQSTDGKIQLDHLPPAVASAKVGLGPARGTERPPSLRPGSEAPATKDVARRARIVALLQQHAGNVSAVAREMGAARAQIHRWVRKYALDPASFRR